MRANEYRLLESCIENGTNIGYVRAYKYTDEPKEDDIKEAIKTAVLNEICEKFYIKGDYKNNL